jgi:hypothetical protein
MTLQILGEWTNGAACKDFRSDQGLSTLGATAIHSDAVVRSDLDCVQVRRTNDSCRCSSHSRFVPCRFSRASRSALLVPLGDRRRFRVLRLTRQVASALGPVMNRFGRSSRRKVSHPQPALPTASAVGVTRHPARVAAKLLKVTGAGTIRKQAAKRKNL